MSNFTQDFTLEQFQKFMDVLVTSAMYLNDVDIVNGVIRQKMANDYTVINVDLKDVFDNSLAISDLKGALPLFETIIPDEKDNIKLWTDDKFFYVAYANSRYRFSIGTHLESKYSEDAGFNRAFAVTEDDNEIVHNIDLVERTDVHKKIKKVCDVYNSDKLTMTIDQGDKGILLSVLSIDKRRKADIYTAANTTYTDKHIITVRAGFLEKLDSKSVQSLTFFKPYRNDESLKGKCAVRALYEIREGLMLKIYSICKAS